MNAPERELAETLSESEIDSSETARRLFAHGLLSEHVELRSPDAAKRREARILAIMQRLDEPAASLECLSAIDSSAIDSRASTDARAIGPVAGTASAGARSISKQRLRRLAAAAAALLLAFLALFWFTADQQNPLPELLAMARENQSRGLHIYRGSIETPHGTYEFDLALAEGGKVQIHYESQRGNFDYGINSRGGWFRTPIGKAVEVPLWDLPPLLDSLPESFKTLGPNLSYLEVEGLLTKILTKEGMRITGRGKTPEGEELVTLEGHYKVQGRKPRWHRHRRRGPCRDGDRGTLGRTCCGPPSVFTGTVKLRISPEKGWIHDIRFKDDRRKAETHLERVLSLSSPGKGERPAWIDFEPEATKTPPSMRLLRFLGSVLRKAREAREAKIRKPR